MTGKEWSGTLTTLDAGGRRKTWNTFSLESDEVHTCSHLDWSIVLFEGTKFVMLWKWIRRRTGIDKYSACDGKGGIDCSSF